jgi:hypothetical protein
LAVSLTSHDELKQIYDDLLKEILTCTPAEISLIFEIPNISTMKVHKGDLVNFTRQYERVYPQSIDNPIQEVIKPQIPFTKQLDSYEADRKRRVYTFTDQNKLYVGFSAYFLNQVQMTSLDNKPLRIEPSQATNLLKTVLSAESDSDPKAKGYHQNLLLTMYCLKLLLKDNQLL